MILDTIAGAIRSACWEFSDWLWPDAALERLERERHWLKLKLRRGYDTLIRQRNSIQSVTTWLAQGETRTAALTQRVETYLGVENRVKAWHHALELDQLRHSMERERGQLDRMRKGYHDQVIAISQLEQRLAKLEEHLDARRLRAGACECLVEAKHR
jgi:hypothetical protein